LYELLILHFILVSCLIKVVFDLRDSDRRELRYQYCGFVHIITHNVWYSMKKQLTIKNLFFLYHCHYTSPLLELVLSLITLLC